MSGFNCLYIQYLFCNIFYSRIKYSLIRVFLEIIVHYVSVHVYNGYLTFFISGIVDSLNIRIGEFQHIPALSLCTSGYFSLKKTGRKIESKNPLTFYL